MSDCIYCNAEVADETRVPALDDEDAWQELAREHATDCEWILTRAHRLPEIQECRKAPADA